jgi:hypothetical protein
MKDVPLDFADHGSPNFFFSPTLREAGFLLCASGGCGKEIACNCMEKLGKLSIQFIMPGQKGT